MMTATNHLVSPAISPTYTPDFDTFQPIKALAIDSL